MSEQLVFRVSDFVAVLNQTLDFAYPSVTIVGELSNFKVSKGKWIYFDLKDDQASVRFFGTIYALPGPLEDGMMLQVTGAPRLHPQFGFSVTAQLITPVGEGSIKKAAKLLEAKLRAEGLFEPSRKRSLPYPPTKIGLVTSGESAAYADFVKILAARWGGVEILHAETLVQGESAPGQIVAAIEKLNMEDSLEAIVIIRGGGSADDLQAFSTEAVVRAVAASRAPTLVAIGHEIDLSLAELAADAAASTPSNAAELLVPDKQAVKVQAAAELAHCRQIISRQLTNDQQYLTDTKQALANKLAAVINQAKQLLIANKQLLKSYDPRQILARGYTLIKSEGKLVTGVEQLKIGNLVDLRLADGQATAEIKQTRKV